MIRYSVLFALCFFLASAPLSHAQEADAAEETSTAKPAKKQKQPASPVVKAVKKMKKVKGRLNAKADYYIYLFSASWCGPCCKDMPEIVEQYKDMKKDGRVEIILMGKDETPEGVKAFMKQFDIKFYGVMSSDKNAKKVPGFSDPSGIPNCTVVDRYGRVITSGHPGGIIPNWQSFTVDKGVPEPPVEDKEK